MTTEMGTLETLAGLRNTPEIASDLSMDLKLEVLVELARRGLAPEPVQESNESPGAQSTVSVFDLLGAYFPDTGRIVVYASMCRQVAEHLGLSFDELVTVVRLHEEAHAVTHRGQDESDTIWENFGFASMKDKELAAQLLTFLYCRECERPGLLKTFRTLADWQEEPYNTWRQHEGASQKEIAAVIGELRRSKSDFILDYVLVAGGPIGFSRQATHYRIKGNRTFLRIADSRQDIVLGGSRTGVVVMKAMKIAKGLSRNIQDRVDYLLYLLLEADKRWPKMDAKRLHVQGAVIDILEGLLDLEPEVHESVVFNISESTFAALHANCREALRVAPTGSHERLGIMDAPSQRITLHLDGEWKTWWGNVGWNVPELEELEEGIRLAARQCGASRW
jgi:hypothetical protein